MRLVCNRPQLHGDYGDVVLGQEFDCEDHTARELIGLGHARIPDPPQVLYETKVVTPEAPQVSARQPFHHLPLSDKEQTAVAPQSDPLLPAADLPEPGTAHPLRRPERKGSGSGR